MRKVEIQIEALELEAGRLCLDFANTAEWHASNHPIESINNYSDLVAWAQRVGLIAEQETQRLSREAEQRPLEAASVFETAISLRDAIYRIFSATAGGRSPDTTDLAILNTALKEALSRLQLTTAEDSITWEWRTDEVALAQMLWPVARSTAKLLTSEDLARVKECEDDRGCGFLFFDSSRNRRRRWCDMKGCGNRAKVRRHRQRKQTADRSST